MRLVICPSFACVAEVTPEALIAFCRGQLVSFKIPRYTVILDAFPMTSGGKVQKFKFREIAAAQAVPGGASPGAMEVNPLQS